MINPTIRFSPLSKNSSAQRTGVLSPASTDAAESDKILRTRSKPISASFSGPSRTNEKPTVDWGPRRHASALVALPQADPPSTPRHRDPSSETRYRGKRVRHGRINVGKNIGSRQEPLLDGFGSVLHPCIDVPLTTTTAVSTSWEARFERLKIILPRGVLTD